MSAEQHKSHAPRSVRVFVVTISDTRTEANDTSGDLAEKLLTDAGHTVSGRRLLRDDPKEVAAVIARIAEHSLADVVVSTGGTGISRRDSTYEAVNALLEKRLDGFGELFRMLSFQEIGSAAMLSRAVSGLYKNLVLFALPGSQNAVRLALEKLIIPELGHLVFEKQR